MIVNVEPSAQLQYALYDEGPSLEVCDLITISMPLSLVRKSHIALTEAARKIDKKLLDGLRRRGFKLDFGKTEPAGSSSTSPVAAATISTSAARI